MEYQPREIEKKWQAWWDREGIYTVSEDPARPKYYILDMFPYPSGAGLHVGHPLGYIASDILSRHRRMLGFNVLHPMGFDAFGLPAEQYAIQTGVHPAESTRENMARYRDQLRNLGFDYDWSREVNTSDPSYYRWTQWIFLRLYDHWFDVRAGRARPIKELEAHFQDRGTTDLPAFTSEEVDFTAEAWRDMDRKARSEVLMNFRLAYRKVSFVNWCEALGTVLANDEVKDGLSERGGYPVERRPMLQWSLRITAYAPRLLQDLDDLAWSDALKAMQRNWIGRSEGARIFFALDGQDEPLEVFTTRPDTLFGVTFMVLAPEHDLVDILTTDGQREEVRNYLAYVQTRSERERQAETRTMTGVFTGGYALHPFTGERLPVWTAEYVLRDYGSGAIMAVPADDDRDRAFALMAGLPVREIIDRSEWPEARREDKIGRLIQSDFLDGLEVKDAILRMLTELESRGIGQRQVNYKLRDALFSRQRYWGEPFPIIYNPEGVPVTVQDEELPVTLPPLDNFKPTPDGQSPLARMAEWVRTSDGLRETDTMPGYAGSSWYFLRYMDPRNHDAFASRSALEYWREVDLYIGGTEHAVGHLMYSRFWHKFLYDIGLVPTTEPFRKLINQGMIQGVIESVFLGKEKRDGRYVIRCASLVTGDAESEYIQIPVHVEFVRDYGSSDSYLDGDGILKFTEWRPEYRSAIFECSQGTWIEGTFTPSGESHSPRLVTKSEVGKMSKSKYNVINPDDVVAEYGADCFRMYEMFLGPVEQSKPWDTHGIDGVSKFLKKLWGLFNPDGDWAVRTDGQADRDSLRILHQSIRKVNDDLDRFSLNTCVSQFMICVNELRRLECRHADVLDPLVRLLAPFAPHVAEELWHCLGRGGSVHLAAWPEFNPDFLAADEVTYPVSINGKRRAEITVASGTGQVDLENAALALPEITRWLEGQSVKKVIIVPGRMVNIVAG